MGSHCESHLLTNANRSAVEDPNGQAITLAIENLNHHEAFHYPVEYFAGRFPAGAMLAIKEPSVCLGRTTGIAEIRVSVPTDIERIPSSDVAWRFDSPVSVKRTERAVC